MESGNKKYGDNPLCRKTVADIIVIRLGDNYRIEVGDLINFNLGTDS